MRSGAIAIESVFRVESTDTKGYPAFRAVAKVLSYLEIGGAPGLAERRTCRKDSDFGLLEATILPDREKASTGPGY